MTEFTDEELMARVAKADQRSLAELMERHMRHSLVLAERIVGGNSEADDVCQEAFLRVWRKAVHFEPRRGSFRTWLYRLVVNLAIDHRRSRSRTHEPLDEAADVAAAGADSEAALIEVERTRAFEVAWRGLAPRQRAAIALYHFDDLSGRDAARSLGLSEKAFESLLNRARKALGKNYRARESGEDYQ